MSRNQSRGELKSVRLSADLRRLQASNATQHFVTQGSCSMKYTLVLGLVILAGCTSMDVKPIPASAKLEKICIQFNEEVNVDDFVPVVQEDFFNHGRSRMDFLT
jgi:hypothetical protein